MLKLQDRKLEIQVIIKKIFNNFKHENSLFLNLSNKIFYCDQKCNFQVITPNFKEFLVPDQLRNKFQFLKNWKFTKQNRIFVNYGNFKDFEDNISYQTFEESISTEQEENVNLVEISKIASSSIITSPFKNTRAEMNLSNKKIEKEDSKENIKKFQTARYSRKTIDDDSSEITKKLVALVDYSIANNTKCKICNASIPKVL